MRRNAASVRPVVHPVTRNSRSEGVCTSVFVSLSSAKRCLLLQNRPKQLQENTAPLNVLMKIAAHVVGLSWSVSSVKSRSLLKAAFLRGDVNSARKNAVVKPKSVADVLNECVSSARSNSAYYRSKLKENSAPRTAFTGTKPSGPSRSVVVVGRNL